MAKAKVLSKDEVKRVMRMADEGCNGLRDKTALSLSIAAGMRIGEICALTIGDVRGLDGKAVSIIHLTKNQTKGNRSRRVFVSEALGKLLNAYLATISDLGDDRAFIRSNRTGGHFSNVTLSTRFKAIYLAAGIATSSHAGRRTFATRMNAAGIGMATIQQAMGHANIATTAGYCWVSDDQLANAVNVI
ncbi:tyrosine-type recombinase/integrase [Novosphingobium humi]|uniref:tyrosine-type recombinase/integrase n=1 Tax=Novosphingobium humi TaxID=2282397 RepID=UPI0025B12BAF|nr:site-specific integrase [Novosphingobium humi]WJS99860.1 site-specific integrase [Novosphingobium humi]